MNVDVVMLVKQSMEKMDCGSAIAGELDAHAPICITFHSIPEMFVELPVHLLRRHRHDPLHRRFP